MFINVLFLACTLSLHATLTVSNPDVPAPCAHAIPAEWVGGDKKPKKGWKCSPQGFIDQPVLLCTQRIGTPPAVSCTTQAKPDEVVLAKSNCDLGYSRSSSNDGIPAGKSKGNVTIEKFFCKDPGFPEPLTCDPGSPSGVFNWCYPAAAFPYKDIPWIYKEAAKSAKMAKPNKVAQPDKAKPGQAKKPDDAKENDGGEDDNEDIVEEDEEEINADIKSANGEDADDHGQAATGNIFASSYASSSTTSDRKFPSVELLLLVVMCIWMNV